MTLADGSTRRVHAKQMQLRSIQLTEDYLAEFANTFNPPVQRPQAANGETGHLDERAVDNQQTSIQQTPAVDNGNPEQSSSALWHPAVLNEVTLQRNHLSWTQEGKRTSIYKLIPAVHILFLFFFFKGRRWDSRSYNVPQSRDTFSYVCLCSGTLSELPDRNHAAAWTVDTESPVLIAIQCSAVRRMC
jgi:hypothetical protein